MKKGVGLVPNSYSFRIAPGQRGHFTSNKSRVLYLIVLRSKWRHTALRRLRNESQQKARKGPFRNGETCDKL